MIFFFFSFFFFFLVLVSVYEKMVVFVKIPKTTGGVYRIGSYSKVVDGYVVVLV